MRTFRDSEGNLIAGYSASEDFTTGSIRLSGSNGIIVQVISNEINGDATVTVQHSVDGQNWQDYKPPVIVRSGAVITEREFVAAHVRVKYESKDADSGEITILMSEINQ